MSDEAFDLTSLLAVERARIVDSYSGPEWHDDRFQRRLTFRRVMQESSAVFREQMFQALGQRYDESDESKDLWRYVADCVDDLLVAWGEPNGATE